MRIAVPSGVGDTYWALTKLRSFRQRHGAESVELCIQASRLKRALEWAEMVDFVDTAVELKFKPDHLALQNGFSQGMTRGADYCFWPNAVIDRGESIGNWLEGYDLDLDFEIKCDEPMVERRGLSVLYTSSMSIGKAWFPNLGVQFWQQVLDGIADTKRAVIGAFWDQPLTTQLDRGGVIDLVAQTTLKEVTGILKSARVVVGVISGMTILANHFKTPCVALCPDKFPPGFPSAWVKPDAPYVVLRASEIESAEHVLDAARSIARVQ